MNMLRVLNRSNGVWRRFLSPDTGAGSGGSDDANQDKPGRDDQPSGETPDELTWLDAADPAERRKQYNETTAGLRSALDAERKGRGDIEKELKALKKIVDGAADQKLEDEKKFAELANERKTKLDQAATQLEGLTQERDAAKASYGALEKLVQEDIDSEIESLNLPKSVLALLKDKPILEQRKWLTEHRDEFRKDTTGDRTRRTPRPDTHELTETERAAKTARSW